MTRDGGWRRFLPALALLLLLTLLLPALASACPLCKEADDGAASTGGGVWRGMYWSILLMIGAPFTMFGLMALMIVRARKRQQSRLPPGARS